MQIVGDRKYVDIPGDKTHELPPLMLKDDSAPGALDRVVALAEQMVESESLVPEVFRDPSESDNAFEQRRFNLAINFAEHYLGFVQHWKWGESIIEWIRQCEVTFEYKPALRPLIHPDLWPHVNQSSFVTLLSDKAVPTGAVNLENAVGFRLAFRQPPPLECLSDKFLVFNAPIAQKAYHTWADAAEEASLPPERFRFLVVGDGIMEV